jgi:hypothetical protein
MTELSELYIQPIVLSRTKTEELMSKYWPADPPMPTDTTQFGKGDAVIMNQSWPGGALVGWSDRHDMTGEMTDPIKFVPINAAEGDGVTSVKSRHVLVCCGSRGTHSVIAKQVYFPDDDKEDVDGGKKEDLPSIIFETEHGIYTVWPETEKTNVQMHAECGAEAKKSLLGPDVDDYLWTKAKQVKYHRIRKD